MSEPIGQTTTTALIFWGDPPRMDWDGIESEARKQGKKKGGL